MTSSQFDQLIRGPISVEQDKNCMDDLLEPTPSVATRPGDVLEPTPSVAARPGDVLGPYTVGGHETGRPPGPSRKDIVHDAVAAAGLQFEWYSTQEDEICSKAQSSDPPTNAPLETDQSPPSSPIPPTQNYMLGDMESAIKHLRTVSELRQWGDEWNVADHPRLLRALEALGDSEAFLALQLQKMVDFQSISDFAGINRVYDNELVRGKTVKYCPRLRHWLSEWRYGHKATSIARPKRNAARSTVSRSSWRKTGRSLASIPWFKARYKPVHFDQKWSLGEGNNTLIASGSLKQHRLRNLGQVIYTRSRVEESTVEATDNTLQTGSFRPEMVAEVQQSVFPLPHDQVTDTDRGSQTDSIRPEMVGHGRPSNWSLWGQSTSTAASRWPSNGG